MEAPEASHASARACEASASVVSNLLVRNEARKEEAGQGRERGEGRGEGRGGGDWKVRGRGGGRDVGREGKGKGER